jgi:hypothetical protein
MKKLIYSILAILWIVLITATVANVGSMQTETKNKIIKQ